MLVLKAENLHTNLNEAILGSSTLERHSSCSTNSIPMFSMYNIIDSVSFFFLKIKLKLSGNGTSSRQKRTELILKEETKKR